MRASFAGLVFSSALLLVPGAAHADKPIVLGPLSDEGIVGVLDCPGFGVMNHYVMNFVARSTVDRNGNVVRMVAQSSGVDTFFNANTGKEITSSYHNTTTVDFRSGLATARGVLAKIIVPGVGPVFKDIGRLVFDGDGNLTFSAGTHQFVDGDFEGLCAALE